MNTTQIKKNDIKNYEETVAYSKFCRDGLRIGLTTAQTYHVWNWFQENFHLKGRFRETFCKTRR